jgi:hypothetical protein
MLKNYFFLDLKLIKSTVFVLLFAVIAANFACREPAAQKTNPPISRTLTLYGATEKTVKF